MSTQNTCINQCTREHTLTVLANFVVTVCRPGAKYIEKYLNTLQLPSLINDYNYITITGPVEM